MGSWQDVYLIPSQILTRRGMLNTRYLLISFIYPKLETTYFNDSFNPYSFLVRVQPKVTFEADFHYPVASDKGAITWALRDISRYLQVGFFSSLHVSILVGDPRKTGFRSGFGIYILLRPSGRIARRSHNSCQSLSVLCVFLTASIS